MIYALHQNPIDINSGSGIRIINILKMIKNVKNEEILLYTLANDSEERVIDGVVERHVQKPWFGRRTSGGYLCLYPFLIRNSIHKLGELAASASTIVFEGPFMGYATMKTYGHFPNSQKIYDAHNVEVNYWSPYLANRPFGNRILRKIWSIEKFVMDHSDFVLVTSEEERNIIENEFHINKDKLVIVPNGVDTSIVTPSTNEEKIFLRNKFGWKYAHYAVFMGSGVKANIDALNWIIKNLASLMPTVAFLIIGSVGRHAVSPPENVKLLGVLPTPEKNSILRLADVAINPVEIGAGTNIKMLEYLSAGIPVLTTKTGARGLNLIHEKDALILDTVCFQEYLLKIFGDEQMIQNLARNARLKSKEFDWNRILFNVEKRIKEQEFQKSDTY